MSKVANKIASLLTRKILITVWQCDNCGKTYQTTEKDSDISCRSCYSDRVIPIDEYEKEIHSRNWYWQAIKWHLQWLIIGHKPSYSLVQEILEHLCSRYFFKHHRKNQKGNFGENYFGKIYFRIISKIGYTLRTGQAWWLQPKKPNRR